MTEQEKILMAIGYMEMAEINLQLSQEFFEAENEVYALHDVYLKRASDK